MAKQTKPKHDPVNNPKHYDLFPDMQSIDIIERALSDEEFVGFLKGNCLKYRIRAGKKGSVQQDIDKANWYQNYLQDFFIRKRRSGGIRKTVRMTRDEVLKDLGVEGIFD